MEMGLELGEQPFYLNTNGCCFICLKSVDKIAVKDELGGEAFSLQNLCRHLKLNVWNALNGTGGSGLPSSIMPPVEKSDLISVSLCQSCRDTALKFSDLLKQLESIRKEMERSLGVIGKCLKETDKDGKLVDQFQKLMGKDVVSKQYLGTVWELRREVAVKCSEAASSSPEPKVEIKRSRKRGPGLKGRSGPGFKCNFCGESFNSIGAVNGHFTKAHLLEVKARASAAEQGSSGFILRDGQGLSPSTSGLQLTSGIGAAAHPVENQNQNLMGHNHVDPEMEAETPCVKIEMICSAPELGDHDWTTFPQDPLSEEVKDDSTTAEGYLEAPKGGVNITHEFPDPLAEPETEEATCDMDMDIKIKQEGLELPQPDPPLQVEMEGTSSLSFTGKRARLIEIDKPQLNSITGKLKCRICSREYSTNLYFESHYRKYHLNS